MTQIIIYTQNDCPPCTFIKNYLTEKQIPYEERNIKNGTYRQQMIDRDAFATPFILLDDEPMYQVDLDRLNQKLGL
ncbi:glutaredoxin family protein [Staphylococcus chromogenes]|uniref:glutaredoxin family protein n=1 Tax=Staphylococcus chromogenes TaxID=46126 RepID=UPI001E42FA01|nr:glutaredoxin family protein [Staphylococcus chromogenes]MCD8905781.1 glutaredoxin family protein [Staphylococcus chromogenes]